MEPEDFFRNGLPRDYCIETALVQDDINNPFACILMNNAALVNMHYSKREVIGRNWKKWFHPAYGKMVFRNMLMLPYREFSSFKYSHISSSFLKSTFERSVEGRRRSAGQSMQDTISFSGGCKSVCDEILAVYGGKI